MIKLDLTKGGIASKMTMVAIPLILSNIVGMVYNFTDMYWVSKYNSEAINAVGVGGLFLWLGGGIGLLTTLGTRVFVANKIGRKEPDEAIKVGRDGLKIAFVVSLLYGVFIFLAKDFLVSLYGYESQQIISFARSYMTVVAFLFPIILINETFSSISNGQGNTVAIFIISFISVGINCVLDPLFILHLDMGVTGAGLATLVAATTSFFLWILYFNVTTDIFTKALLKSNGYVKKILKFGTVPMLLGVAFPFINLFMANRVIKFGDDYGGIVRVGAQIESFAWFIGIGVSGAITTFIAQNFAARQVKRMRKAIMIMCAFVTVYAGIIMYLFIFHGDVFFRIFYSKSDEAHMVEYGAHYLFILAFSLHAMLFEGIFTGVLNGIKRSTAPAFISLVGNGLRIPLVVILPLFFGVTGLWLSYVISSCLKALGVFLYYFFATDLSDFSKIDKENDKSSSSDENENQIKTEKLATT